MGVVSKTHAAWALEHTFVHSTSVGTMFWGDGSSTSLANLEIDNRCTALGSGCDWLSVTNTYGHRYPAANAGGNNPYRVSMAIT